MYILYKIGFKSKLTQSVKGVTNVGYGVKNIGNNCMVI